MSRRLPDPVLQQVEHWGDPTLSVNDAFKPVTRYWDRITRPEQLLQSLPQALGVLLDPADCGPAFLGLCQDVQAEAFDYPERFFAPTVHHIPRPRPDLRQLEQAAALLRTARKPLLIAGGGVRYSGAEAALAAFAERHRVPVVETIAGRTVLVHDHPLNAGPIGGLGSSSANELAAEADVVLAVGTRLQDFTTGSWSLFADDARFIGLNAARFDARKHQALPVVGDAQVGPGGAGCRPSHGWQAPDAWLAQSQARLWRVERLRRPAQRPDQRRAADLRPRRRRHQPPGRPARPGAHRRRRHAGRAVHELARQDLLDLRLRVRLLLHGLRDRRRLGRQARRPDRAT